MKFTTITKWEFLGALKSKKFIMIFFLQISVLLLMIVIFNSFAATIESEKGISITPSLNGFASMDVQDQSGLISKYVNPEIINITNSTYNNSINSVVNGQTTGFLYVPGDADNIIRKGQTVNLVVYLDAADPKRSVVRDEVNSTAKLISQSYSAILTTAVSPNVTNSSVNQQNNGESLTLQIIKKVMIVILLFLPLLLFGNMIIDSVVGEKERKTGEIIIAMPISHTQIIVGKSMAVALTMTLQVLIWIIVLLIAGFQIHNPLLVFIFISLTSIPIIGITTMVAAYSKNYKEAGIGLSIVYLVIVAFLVIPTLVYISRKSFLANISPMTLVMRLFSGETIYIGDYLLTLLSIMVVSIVSYWLSVKLFERDDITFGPRPGIFRLIYELITLKIR